MASKPTTSITGFWTFFCNPKFWHVDLFLTAAKEGQRFPYRVTQWQEPFFEKGQLGIIRVGADARNKTELGGRQKLIRGVYAIVQVTGKATVKGPGAKFKIAGQKGEETRASVPLKLLKNYIDSPVLFEEIESDFIIKADRYLLKGIPAASMPLGEEAFNRLLLYGEKKR